MGKFVILATPSGSGDAVVQRNSGHNDMKGFQATQITTVFFTGIVPCLSKQKLTAQ